MMKVMVVCVLALAVCACQQETSNNTLFEAENLTEETPTPVPHYETKDGDTYIYTGILNDSDGQPSTNVILSYRFLGRNGDVYRLESVNDYGTATGVVECSVPCRVVKNIGMDGTISRQVVNKDSIVAVAFLDAANGLLGPAKAP